MSAIERVGRVVRSKTAAVGAASLLAGAAIGANLPRGGELAPETTPTPIARVGEPPRPTQTPFEFRTQAPFRTIAPTPIQTPLETKTPETIRENQFEGLTQALEGFFSNSFIGREGLKSVSKAVLEDPNKIPVLELQSTLFNTPSQEVSWWIRIQNPNNIVDKSTLSISSSHDKKTNEIKETESIIWANFDKIPELAAFTSKDKHGYFTLPQDKLRQFVEASGIFDTAFVSKLKSFTWEKFSKQKASDVGAEQIPAVRAKGKIGNFQVELTIDAQGVVVLRTTKG